MTTNRQKKYSRDLAVHFSSSNASNLSKSKTDRLRVRRLAATIHLMLARQKRIELLGIGDVVYLRLYRRIFVL
jgi:hypothetical protein